MGHAINYTMRLTGTLSIASYAELVQLEIALLKAVAMQAVALVPVVAYSVFNGKKNI